MSSQAPTVDRWTGDIEAILGLQPAEEPQACGDAPPTTSRRLAWATSICIAAAGAGLAVVAVRSDRLGALADDVRRLVEPAAATAPQVPAPPVRQVTGDARPAAVQPGATGPTSDGAVTPRDLDAGTAGPAALDTRAASSPVAAPPRRTSRPAVAGDVAPAGPGSRPAPVPDATRQPEGAPATPRVARDARPSAAPAPEIPDPATLAPASPPVPAAPGAAKDRPGSLDGQATSQPTPVRQKPTKTEAIDAMRMLRRQ